MLNEKLKNKNLILASGSLRRQEFLNELGLEFQIRLKPVNEIYPPHLKQTEVAEYLATLKAKAFETELKPNDLIITGDTIVCTTNQIFGKPKSKTEAKAMLLALSNKAHQVISSVCLKSSRKTEVFHDTTTVYFKPLTQEEIDYYITTYQPFDKAGAYGIQEWIGQIGVQKIEGSYYTVMGMPLHLLYKKLLQF